MADSEYESVLCVKNEVFVYQIPARTSNRGYRAADWNLDKPNWVGRMKVISKGKNLFIRLEDKNTGELFAQCPVDSYPGIAVEQVLDSSRYFVIRIQDENVDINPEDDGSSLSDRKRFDLSGRKAFIGIGFADRGDSFDLLVAMQDHFKWIKREETQLEEEKDNKDLLSSGPKLDLGFKEGQTIRINIATKKNREHGSPSSVGKQRTRGQTGTGILPPPPGGTRIAPPPRAPSAISATPSHQNDQQTDLFTRSQPNPEKTGNSSGSQSNVDLLLTFESSCAVSSSTNQGSAGANAPTQEPHKAAKPAESADPWGDFTSATSTKPGNQSSQQTGGWVSFE